MPVAAQASPHSALSTNPRTKHQPTAARSMADPWAPIQVNQRQVPTARLMKQVAARIRMKRNHRMMAAQLAMTVMTSVVTMSRPPAGTFFQMRNLLVSSAKKSIGHNLRTRMAI